ncbi:synaptotagmin-like protein 4 isoform X2 [Carcharodon carcharias]|uniref:synaptotagmin-like protein 4 isoform X2 n=1 Tax=Carcharodon carcharias TaxID=13397 RepID=UPI001B7E4A51|nr:synaptotagmin-like protein 4 isoform X2 [Carcharodon carcharias]
MKMATSTEPEMLIEAKPLVTKKPVLIQRVRTFPPSNSDTPDEGSKNENTKTNEYSGPSVQERMQQILQQRKTQTEKKRLNTKYFPKVLPTEPEEIKVKLKKANASNENELFPMSSDFQKDPAEVEEAAQDKTICQPKLKELNSLNIGLQKRLQEKDENKTSPVEKQDNYEKGLQPDHQTFMLSDNEPVDRKMANTQLLFEDTNLRNSQNKPNASNNIRNNEEENIPEKRFHSQIPSVLKPTGISFQDENSSIGQSASNEVSSNEENLALFVGRSSVIEENDIPQKKLNKSESLDNKIQGSLKPDEISFEEEKIPPVKTDNDSKYDEDLRIALDKDKRGFDQEDEFQSELNLLSGITKMSNFKECNVRPTKKSTGTFKSDIPYNFDQDALPKNVLSDYSGGNDHLRAETWRSSLSEEEEMFPLVLRRNSHTNETYKSLEDINGVSSMPSTLDSTNKEMILSAQNVSTIPASPENTLLQSKRMKRLSKSVPAFPEVSGSTMSVYSGDFGNIDVRGKIQFSLDYVDKLKEFHIFVVRCSDLAAAEEKKNRSDPYVKSYLLPDKIKMGKRKTSVKKKSLNPVYNEVLRYKIEKATLMAQTLNLSVWHNDTFGRNSFLGEVEVELKKWDWSNKKMDWHKLKPRTLSVNRMDDRGSLKVAFRYIPQGQGGKKTGEVQIWVKEASNLPQIRPNRLDPFVKCFILPDTSRKSRQKTRVVKKNRNPVFNHTMVYDGFRTEDLKDACVELSVWDHDKLLNHFLGGLRIGLGTGKSYGQAVDWMDSTEEEVSVWDKMITHPNTWIEDVLPLRMLMLSKMSGN